MLDSVKNDRSRGLLMRPTNAWPMGDGPALLSVVDDDDVAVVDVVVVATLLEKRKTFDYESSNHRNFHKKGLLIIGLSISFILRLPFLLFVRNVSPSFKALA
jgi:hypothetical protein